jgi:hypothetical protein
MSFFQMFTDFKEEILNMFLIQINTQYINTILQLILHLKSVFKELLEYQGQLILIQNGSDNISSVHNDIYFESSQWGSE